MPAPTNKYSFDSRVFWIETAEGSKTAHHGYVVSITNTGGVYSYIIIDDFSASFTKAENQITDVETEIIDQLNAK